VHRIDEGHIVVPDHRHVFRAAQSTRPALRPRTTINHNLSVEWYPNKDTLFTASAYRQIGKIGASKTDSLHRFRRQPHAATVEPDQGSTGPAQR
jgi:hypothetical protein